MASTERYLRVRALVLISVYDQVESELLLCGERPDDLSRCMFLIEPSAFALFSRGGVRMGVFTDCVSSPLGVFF